MQNPTPITLPGGIDGSPRPAALPILEAAEGGADQDATVATVHGYPIEDDAAPTPDAGADGAAAGLTLTSILEHESLPLTPQRIGVVARLTGRCMTEAELSEKPPIDLVAAVDVSGSMAPAIDLLRQTMGFVTKELRSCDRLSIVTFASDAVVLLPHTAMNAEGKAAAATAIAQIRAGGATNFSGGVLTSLSELKMARITSNQDKVSPAAVVVLTDGHPTAGIQGPVKIKQAIQAAHADIGFTAPLFTFGFSKSHDSQLLTDLAEATGGLYSYLNDAEDIASSFAECLGGITSLVAQTVQLTVSASGSSSIHRVMTGSSTRGPGKDTRGPTLTYFIGDILSESNRDTLIECDLPKATCGQQEILQLKVSYFDLRSNMMAHQTTTVAVKRDRAPLGQASVDVETQRQRIVVAEAMEEANTVAAQGNIAAARAKLESTRANLQASVAGSSKLGEALARDLQHSIDLMTDRHAYERVGSHKLSMMSSSHRYQRSTTSSRDADLDGSYYSNSIQRATVSRSRKLTAGTKTTSGARHLKSPSASVVVVTPSNASVTSERARPSAKRRFVAAVRTALGCADSDT